jgi:hypothetical protein
MLWVLIVAALAAAASLFKKLWCRMTGRGGEGDRPQ